MTMCNVVTGNGCAVSDADENADRETCVLQPALLCVRLSCRGAPMPPCPLAARHASLHDGCDSHTRHTTPAHTGTAPGNTDSHTTRVTKRQATDRGTSVHACSSSQLSTSTPRADRVLTRPQLARVPSALPPSTAVPWDGAPSRERRGGWSSRSSRRDCRSARRSAARC